MSDLQNTVAPEGQTRMTGTAGVASGCVYGAGAHDLPAYIGLETIDDAGVSVINYLWFDSTGDLRTATSLPTDQDADGTIVGVQL